MISNATHIPAGNLLTDDRSTVQEMIVQNITNTRRRLWHWLLISVPLFVAATIDLSPAVFAQQPAKRPPAKKVAKRSLVLGDALSASQNTRREVEFTKNNGEKGLLQQAPLIDLMRESRELQIALVLDATDSMGRDLSSLKDGLKVFVEKVNERRKGLVTQVAVVVYRDFNSKSGPTTIITPDFMSADNPELITLIGDIEPQNGAPFFPEQVDRGLYAALTKLDWSESKKTVARSIILAGDAPPFDEGHMTTKVNSAGAIISGGPNANAPGTFTLRGHRNSELVDLAKKKDVRIFSVICNSGFYDHDDATLVESARVYNPEFEHFAEVLAAGTNGAVLNLGSPDTVDQLLQKTDDAERLVKLEPIQKADVDQRINDGGVRIAVLPPLPLNELKTKASGWQKTDAYTFACTALNRLEEIDSRGIVKMSPALWNSFALACLQAEDDPQQKANLQPEYVLKALGDKLDLDFVIWGDYTRQGDGHKIILRVFDRSGKELAKTDEVMSEKTISGLVLPAFAELSTKLNISATAAQHGKRQIALKQLLVSTKSVAAQKSWDDQLVNGYDLLEESTALDFKDPKSLELNEKARELLKKYLMMREDDALSLLLLSSCERNLENIAEADQQLSLAYDNRESADPQLKLEIEADYALFKLKAPTVAIKAYQDLVALCEKDLQVYSKQARRAKWMLSGLYLGGWGFAATNEFKQQPQKYFDEARQLLLDIVVYWPDSPEAEYFGKHISPPLRRQARSENVPNQLSLNVFPVTPTLPRPTFASLD